MNFNCIFLLTAFMTIHCQKLKEDKSADAIPVSADNPSTAPETAVEAVVEGPSIDSIATSSADLDREANTEKRIKELEMQISALNAESRSSAKKHLSEIQKDKAQIVALENDLAHLKKEAKSFQASYIETATWNQFKKKYSTRRILFQNDFNSMMHKIESKKIGLLVGYTKNNRWLVNLPTELQQNTEGILANTELWEAIEFQDTKIYVEKIGLDNIHQSFSLERGEEFLNDLIKAFESASVKGIEVLILPPIMTIEDNKIYKDWNESAYSILVKALVEHIGSSPTKTQFLLYRWVELRRPVETLISKIYWPYFVGAEEGLPDLNCWLPEEKEQDLHFLHFEAERWLRNEPREFDRYTLSLMSEEKARNFVIIPDHDLLVHRRDRKPVTGYGKYVLKSNGCLYFRDMMEAVQTEGQDYTHVSLNKGKKILAGGWMLLKDGEVKCVNRITGHYRADLDHFSYFLSYLEKRNIKPSLVREDLEFTSCCGEIERLKIRIPPYLQNYCKKAKLNK